MSTPIPRRTILTAAGATAVGLSVPGVAAAAGRPRPSNTITFTLNAETLDGGEQVTSLTLHTAGLGPIDPASLRPETFRVHVKATSPIPVPANDIFSVYDLDRTVTDIRVNRRGDIVVDLDHAEGQVGGGTLGYIVSRGRNVQLELDYTVTQNEPIRLRNRRSVQIEKLVQGSLVNPEVDVFSYHGSRSTLKYRLYTPTRHKHGSKRPLIVWLHGGGEGGSLKDGYYDNETTLRANRGALGFATDEAQSIFGGAYVVAPQSTSYWIEDGNRFAPQIHAIVDELARRYRIDRDRIYVAGCSNGGYMTLKMTTVYPRTFAASVPICGVVQPFGGTSTPLIPDAQLTAITTPTWLVASADDATVNPVTNTEHAHDLIPDSLLTMYENVTWDGYRFPGHWSWIYVARNDPKIANTRIWQWMARQRA